MFCPTCGTESTEHLKYCRNCGAGLNPAAVAAKPESRPFRLTLLFLIIAVVGFGGFVGILMMADSLIRRGVNYDTMMPILGIGAGIIFALLGLLTWLLTRMINLPQQTDRSPLFNKAINERPPVPQIAAPPHINPSVIEHTTRNFEHARYVDPSTQKTSG